MSTIKENITGTLQEFTYLPEQVTEISNPAPIIGANKPYNTYITMKTNFEYLAKILKDDAIDTWTLREQEEINELDLTQGLHIFLYDIYTGIISYCQTNKPTNQEPIYESEHIIILDSDSTIDCQE